LHVKGHRKGSCHEIRNSQGKYEVVGCLSQTFIKQNSHAHEQISTDRSSNDDYKNRDDNNEKKFVENCRIGSYEIRRCVGGSIVGVSLHFESFVGQ